MAINFLLICSAENGNGVPLKLAFVRYAQFICLKNEIAFDISPIHYNILQSNFVQRKINVCHSVGIDLFHSGKEEECHGLVYNLSEM